MGERALPTQGGRSKTAYSARPAAAKAARPPPHLLPGLRFPPLLCGGLGSSPPPLAAADVWAAGTRGAGSTGIAEKDRHASYRGKDQARALRPLSPGAGSRPAAPSPSGPRAAPSPGRGRVRGLSLGLVPSSCPERVIEAALTLCSSHFTPGPPDAHERLQHCASTTPRAPRPPASRTRPPPWPAGPRPSPGPAAVSFPTH